MLRMKSVHREHLSILVNLINPCSICENPGKFLYFPRKVKWHYIQEENRADP